MPVYESIKNADNHIVISVQNRDSVVFGWDKVVSALAEKAGQGGRNIAIDGWYGIDYAKIATALADAIKARTGTERFEDAFVHIVKEAKV